MTLVVLWTGTFLHDALPHEHGASVGHGHGHGHSHSHGKSTAVAHRNHDHKANKAAVASQQNFDDDSMQHLHGASAVSRVELSSDLDLDATIFHQPASIFNFATEQVIAARYQRPPPLFNDIEPSCPLYLANRALLI